MPISQKIIDRVLSSATTDEECKLMMEILNIEDKGSHRYESAYGKAIDIFIAVNDKE